MASASKIFQARDPCQVTSDEMAIPKDFVSPGAVLETSGDGAILFNVIDKGICTPIFGIKWISEIYGRSSTLATWPLCSDVLDQHHRFPISELRRRFMRDDGATCEGLKRFTCVLHAAFYNGLHRSRLFNETFRTWSHEVMITPLWCIWMMLRFWRISRLVTRSWTQVLAQRLGWSLHVHFITSIAQGEWNLYLHCQCIWAATKVTSEWEGVRCAHICTLHPDAVVKAAYAMRWLKKVRFVDAFVLSFQVFEDHVVFESLQIFIQAFQHMPKKP